MPSTSRTCRVACALVLLLATSAVAAPSPLFVLYPVIGAVEDHFGNGLAVTDRQVLVSSSLEDSPGATSLFDLESGAPLATFQDPHPTDISDLDGFGYLVASSNRLLAIARAVPPAIFVYDRCGRPEGTIDMGNDPDDPCKWIGALAIHGKRIAAATQCGVLIVDWPHQQRRMIPRPSDNTDQSFGISLAMMGRRLFVGSIHETLDSTKPGHVYAFDVETGAPLWEAHAPAATARDHFGWSLQAVGSDLLVGAPLDDGDGPDTGAVYVLGGTTGVLRGRYANPSGHSGERFGHAVASDRRIVVIGAPEADVDEREAGVAYVLDAHSGALVQTLAPRPNEETANAARAVALTRTRILVGGSDWSGIGMVAVYER